MNGLGAMVTKTNQMSGPRKKSVVLSSRSTVHRRPGRARLARRLAGHFGFDFLDTGSLYRGVGLSVLRQGLDPADEKAATAAAKALKPEILGGLRDPRRSHQRGRLQGRGHPIGPGRHPQLAA